MTPLRKRTLQGFTLVELMIVVAILGVLATIALPAYNNYALKSRFSEVVLATNPTKTAISTCAETGDCLAGNTLSLGTTTNGATLTISTVPNPQNTSDAFVYAEAYAIAITMGYTTAQAPQVAQSFVNSQENSKTSNGVPAYYVTVSPDGQYACLLPYDNSATCSAGTSAASRAPTNQAAAALTSTLNPYYSSIPSVNGVSSLPCVGGTGCTPSTKYVASVSYTSAGVITGTATSSYGLNSETFTLTPAYASGRVDWASSGTCKTRSGGAIC